MSSNNGIRWNIVAIVGALALAVGVGVWAFIQTPTAPPENQSEIVWQNYDPDSWTSREEAERECDDVVQVATPAGSPSQFGCQRTYHASIAEAIAAPPCSGAPQQERVLYEWSGGRFTCELTDQTP